MKRFTKENEVLDTKLDNVNLSVFFDQMKRIGGYQAAHLYEAAEVIKKAKKEKCFSFLSFPSCLIATGTRGAINHLIENDYVDIVITTCGTVDHDVSRSYSSYHCGSFDWDDKELADQNIFREGNVAYPNENYGPVIEKFCYPILSKLFKEKESVSTADICYALGKQMFLDGKKDSFLAKCYKKKIKVIIPGPTDGAMGAVLFTCYQDNKLNRVDVMSDEQILSDISFENQKTSAIIVGGGISKHHVIWWNQYNNGLDYSVYLTTAQEYDGSLSGATSSEAISWHKIAPEAKCATVYCDASISLPLIAGYLTSPSE